MLGIPLRALLAPLLLVAVALVAPAPASAAGTTITLDGVRVVVTAQTRQVVTVNRTSGWHARVTWWNRRTDGRWVARMTARDGRVGYAGLVPAGQRRQGSGKTPLGTFRLPSAFGTHARDASWDLPYRRMRSGDYWVGDNESRYYNRYRNKADGGFRWWLDPSRYNASERLLDYAQQYEYAVTTSFNQAQVRGRGFAIFLHVNGSGATAGCISVPRWFLVRAMGWLHPDNDPRIAVGW